MIEIKYNYFSEMQRPSNPTPSPSFLQKFQGKNQRINRDGLLQLLNAKRQSLCTKVCYQEGEKNIKMQVPKVRVEKDLVVSKKVKAISSQKQLCKEQKKIFFSQQMRENNGSRSQATLNRRAFLLRNQKNQPDNVEKSNHFKLPLISKSNPTRILSRNVFIPKLEMIESDRPYNKKLKSGSIYSSKSERAAKQMELDQYVLRHLQFLDKFEQQFVSSRGNLVSHSSQS